MIFCHRKTLFVSFLDETKRVSIQKNHKKSSTSVGANSLFGYIQKFPLILRSEICRMLDAGRFNLEFKNKFQFFKNKKYQLATSNT
jgi:hypothetical protein